MLPRWANQGCFNARCHTRFVPALYRQRNIIERAIGHLKDKRAIGTRYDKLALNDQSLVQVALIFYFRHLHPLDRA
jgi:transposase